VPKNEDLHERLDALREHRDFHEKTLDFHRELNSDPRLPTGRDLPLDELLRREERRTGKRLTPVKEAP
jgi:hypothetical protein